MTLTFNTHISLLTQSVACIYQLSGRRLQKFLKNPLFSLFPIQKPNKNIKVSSFKSSENIQKKEGGPDRSVSDNQSSSVTLNELVMKKVIH